VAKTGSGHSALGTRHLAFGAGGAASSRSCRKVGAQVGAAELDGPRGSPSLCFIAPQFVRDILRQA